MMRVSQALISFYKKNVSSGLPDRCIYTPSCSSYTYQAIEKYGVLRGCFMGLKRILRCNPLAGGGFDPVKENYRGKAKWLL